MEPKETLRDAESPNALRNEHWGTIRKHIRKPKDYKKLKGTQRSPKKFKGSSKGQFVG